MATTAQPTSLTRPARVERLALAGAGAMWALHAGPAAAMPGAAMTAWARLAPLALTLLPAALLWCRYARLRPGVRALWCLAVGIAPVADGSLHVKTWMTTGRLGTDVTGLAAAVAGITFVTLAIVVPVVHGDEAPMRGRWLRRVRAPVAALVLVPLVALPWGGAVVQTHPMREAPPTRPDPTYRDVVLVTEDGVQLSGWYRPSANGAAVVLVPSASGSRRTVLSHAQMLSRHGYGVLLYDSRGSGVSEGMRNAYGWTWTADVRAAVRYVTAQPDVTSGRVAALGLSTGADVLLEAAADPSSGLTAVVADGATGRSEADLAPTGWLESLPLRGTFGAIRILTGTTPGPPLALLADRMRGTPSLFVAAGSIPVEIPFNEQYARAAHANLWALPRVAHTQALAELPDEYELRIVGFLDRAVAEGPPIRHVDPTGSSHGDLDHVKGVPPWQLSPAFRETAGSGATRGPRSSPGPQQAADIPAQRP